MSTSRPAVRVLVVEPQEPALRRLGTARTLTRLGFDARIEVLHDPDAVADRVAVVGADLLVLDEALGAPGLALLDQMRPDDPPVLFVVRQGGETLAVEAFRRGATDCVHAGPDYEEVLPAAALELVQRWRGARERGAARKRIRELEHLHESVVDAIPLAVAVLDEERRLLEANPAFVRLSGAPLEALRGRMVAEVLPKALVAGGVGKALETPPSPTLPGPRLVRLEGRAPRAFDVRVRHLDGGRSLLLLSEVTEMEALLRQVGELQRYNENVIQNMNSALVVVDTEGRISHANPMADRVLGAEAGTLAGQSIWEWFPDRPREGTLVWRTLSEGVRFRGAETVARRPDGRLVPIGASCAPLVDGEGRREGAVAIFQDLTEIKQLQRQVLQTEKMASIGQLAAGVAHEINNPMGFIHANLYQMSEYLDDLARLWEKVRELHKSALESGARDEDVHRTAVELSALMDELEADYLLEDIGKAARESIEGSERIRAIVQDLRAFSHQDTAERCLTDINQALDSTANIVWTMMKHSVVLAKHYEELPPVLCFPMQLKQVFMNLLVNAYQAIEVRVARVPGRGEIRLRTQLRDGGVAVEVTDNGTGIEPAHLDRIFDPFFTTKEVGVGTGLGLSTSFNLVKRHGGALSVRSQPGLGSTFEVWLPVVDPETADGP